MSWTPLLTGELAERALTKAREIAVAHAETVKAAPPDRVLFWAYTSAVFDEAFANDAYGAAIDDLVEELRRGVPRLGLYGGLSHAGWVLCHTMDPDDSEEALSAIDEVLLGVLRVDEWKGAHDLIEGLAGIGVYFLERIGHASGHASGHGAAHEALARVVTHLDRTATKTEHGTTWHTPLRLVPPSFAIDYPGGFYDCGLAHGTPGMIGVLARAAKHVDEARPLALEARRWVEAQKTEAGFPGKLMGANLAERERARTAWCYGDPGVALGLYAANAAFGGAITDPVELALTSMRRDAATAGVKDSTMCHGAAGLGHLCNRFFHASGNPTFGDEARTWFARALDMPLPDEPAFLDGSAGVGLALLAATTASEPAWDRLLLADLEQG